MFDGDGGMGVEGYGFGVGGNGGGQIPFMWLIGIIIALVIIKIAMGIP